MPWTTPATWLAGSPLLAAQLNVGVRDNLNALKAPPAARYDINSGYVPVNFNNTTWIEPDTTNLTLGLTTTGGRLMIAFHCLLTHSATPDFVYVNIGVDGVYVGDANFGVGGLDVTTAGRYYCFDVTHFTAALSAGAHTVKIFMVTALGNTISMTNPSLYVQEI